MFVIDADGTASSFGGTAALVYDRLRLVADVTFTGGEAQRYYLESDTDNIFRLDIRNQAQREFADVFSIANPSADFNDGAANGATYITNRYTITIQEGYNVFTDGVPVFTLDKGSTFTPNPANAIVVNSVQPYHHYDEWAGESDLNWDDNLAGYIASNSTTGARRVPMLTYFPSYDGTAKTMQEVYTDEAAFLGFLSATPGACIVRFRYYDSAGSLLDQDQIFTDYGDGSGLIPCGPVNITNLNASADYYTVEVTDNSDNAVTLPYAFKVLRDCTRERRRIFALNKFGSIDAFTWVSRESRVNINARDTVSKPTMPASVNSTGGDWQRRTWRNNPTRIYSNLSQPMSRALLRWVSDEIIESPDVRTVIHEPSIVGPDFPRWWTRVILTRTEDELGFEHGRLRIEYTYGVDNQVQTR